MGACCATPATQEERERNQAIEEEIKKDKQLHRNELKVLILGTLNCCCTGVSTYSFCLGPGESGKSTFVKQMKIIHTNGFSEKERRGYIERIHGHIFEGMANLINGCWLLSIKMKKVNVVT